MRHEETTLEKKMEESRVVVICGYIDSEKASDIIFKLLTYRSEDEDEPINLFIGSNGGNYLDMLAVYDAIKEISNPIIGTCIGSAGGYAALILAGCEKGKRYALKHAEISFEQPYGYLQAGANQQTEIAIAAKEVANERQTFEKLLASETGRDVRDIHVDCEAGVKLTAEEAKAYGIIDEIIE